jgi:thiosulfate dehydrogenase (quinone) large subunit
MASLKTRPITHDGHRLDSEGVTPVEAITTPSAARKVWAATRISLGFIFLWAFLDKAFALGFTTGRGEDGTVAYFGEGAAWFNGGSPTEGFLTFGTSGPLAGFFQSFAGHPVANTLFMVGLLGIGVALLLGIGMRIAAVSGAVMMILMWAAALWPANNPFMDDHIVYALVLIGLALVHAGDTWGLGARWRETELVKRFPILS